jgi:hypothetical protein
MISRAIGVVALLLYVSPARAQTIVRDSVWDYVDSYSRGRVTISAASGDTVAITCSADANSNWGPDVRFTAAAPWSVDALSTTTSNFFGFSGSSTSSRLEVRWPDGDGDSWKITFVSSRGTNLIGPASSDPSAATRLAAGARSGWLYNASGFVTRLTKHGRVAITYPVADWVRSFEMVFNEEQRLALKGMHDRCSKRYEGTQRKATQ